MPAQTTDELVVSRAGTLYKLTAQDLADLANGATYSQEIRLRMTSGSTAVGLDGATITVVGGTVSFGGPTGANRWLCTCRKIYTGAATAGTSIGIRTSYAPLVWGSSAGVGGFVAKFVFGQTQNINGGQAFFGVKASSAVLATTAGAVSAQVNCLGMGYDTTDASTGNWFLFRNDGSGTCTKVDLGTDAARNTTHGYMLEITAVAGQTALGVKITNLATNVVVLDTTYDTDVPGSTTALCLSMEANNGAVASAPAISIADLNVQSPI